MPFELSRLVKVRPVLFHITRRANLESIRAHQRLFCASELFAEAGAAERITEHRPHDPVLLRIGSHTVLINDQRPLRAEWIDFEEGWDFPHLIAHLNARVFFWPGTTRGPNQYGRNHAACYDKHDAIVIRVSTQHLLDANPRAEPEFCRYNSGAPSPRSRPNPRGSRTFLSAHLFELSASGVAEVTFPDSVELPADTQLRDGDWNRWVPLFG
ncbi:MAG: hypothetical protein L0241_04330 [Planctomycetia bacterium]|nr:hypothetical protein [Planctomycetia bacterium]